MHTNKNHNDDFGGYTDFYTLNGVLNSVVCRRFSHRLVASYAPRVIRILFDGCGEVDV